MQQFTLPRVFRGSPSALQAGVHAAAAVAALGAGAAVAHGGWSRALVAGGALLAVVAIGAVVLRERGVLAWILVAPLAYPFLRYPSGGQGLTFDRVAVGVLAVVYLIGATGRIRARESRWLFVALVAFAVAFGLRAIFTTGGTGAALSLWVTTLLLPLLLFIVVRGYVGESLNVRSVLGCLAVAGGIVAVIGVAEAWLGFSLAKATGSEVTVDTNINAVRVSGPYENSQPYECVVVIGLAATLAWMQLSGFRVRLFGLGLVFVQLLGLLYGYNRSGWLAALIVVLLWALWSVGRTTRGRIGLLLVGVAIFYLGSHALSSNRAFTERLQNEASVESRLATYQQAKALLADAPVFGVGIRQYTRAAESSIVHPVVGGNPAATTTHNTPLNVLLEQGLIGAFAFLFVIVATAALLFRTAKSRDKETRVVAIVTLGAAVGYGSFAMTDTMLSYGAPSAFILVLLGCAAGLRDRDAERAPAPA